MWVFILPSHSGDGRPNSNDPVSEVGKQRCLGHSTKTKRQQEENLFFLRVCHLVHSVIGDVISVEKTVKRCLLDTFKHTDEEFLKQASSQ